jgi:hypothetical protein
VDRLSIVIIRAAILLAALGALVALAVPASASRATRVSTATKNIKVDPCQSSGAFAYCSSSGNVNDPRSVVFHVVVAPGQRVEGSWAINCTKGTQGGSSGGIVKGLAPQAKKLRLPLTDPSSCAISANAQLKKSGSIHTWLAVTVPG